MIQRCIQTSAAKVADKRTRQQHVANDKAPESKVYLDDRGQLVKQRLQIIRGRCKTIFASAVNGTTLSFLWSPNEMVSKKQKSREAWQTWAVHFAEDVAHLVISRGIVVDMIRKAVDVCK